MSDPIRPEQPEGAVPRGAGREPADLPVEDIAAAEETDAVQAAAAADDPAPEPADHDDADPPAEAEMTFLDHLEELRTVIIRSTVAALLATVICWFFSADLLDLLVDPVKHTGVYFTAPNEAFLVRLKLSLIVGVFLVLPFILWQLYGFILPGLYTSERRVMTPLIIATTLLFYLGVAFSFLVVSPMVITFLLTFGTDVMQPLLGVGPYFAFVARLSLAFGLIFELPVLIFFLSVTGILEPRMLLRTWRYALVLIAMAAAVLTPPDIFSQVAMAIPVTLLYLGSVLVSIWATRRRRKAEDDADTDADED